MTPRWRRRLIVLCALWMAWWCLTSSRPPFQNRPAFQQAQRPENSPQARKGFCDESRILRSLRHSLAGTRRTAHLARHFLYRGGGAGGGGAATGGEYGEQRLNGRYPRAEWRRCERCQLQQPAATIGA